jgi:uncharacterized protein YozE (UPF0346 family)
MKLTFKHWLFNQKDRKDDIGKFARAMLKVDFSFVQSKRRWDEHKQWAGIVTRQDKQEHVFAFNRAWREYQSVEKTMESAG